MPWSISDSTPLIVGTLLVFLARVSDVTLGTLRIAFISKGEKYLAPMFAFFEMLIWLFAISQIAQHMDNVVFYLAYAAGFASGVFVGIKVEEKLALGTRLIRTITGKDAGELIERLRESGYGVTSVQGTGAAGDVNVIYSVIKRSEMTHYVNLVMRLNPNAFYSIEDVRFVSEGVFRPTRPFFITRLARLRMWGKTK